MLTRILNTLKKDDAVFFDPVDERSLRFISSLLSSHRFPPVPVDYIALLKQTDGLSWNGVELYGTRANDRESAGYTLPGLIEANLEFQQVPPMRGKLLLGRGFFITSRVAPVSTISPSFITQTRFAMRETMSKSCEINKTASPNSFCKEDNNSRICA